VSFIKFVEINSFRFPLKKPFANHVRRITHINAVEVRIFTCSGMVGNGFIYSLGIISAKEIISHLTDDLVPQLLDINNFVGNAKALKEKWTELWDEYKKLKLNQDQLYALACIDVAIWDIFTKSNGISLHKFLGAAKSKIPAYGTTGWLSLTEKELLDECRYYIDKGVSAFKVRLGRPDDFSRIEALRSMMGNELILMLDANQRYSVEDAATISEKLAQFNILWFEEPTSNELLSIERIKQASKLPIALGENILDEKDFEKICRKKMIDYLQPDIPRCGGITGFCRVAKIALKYDIPICNHLLFELSTSLISAYPNGFMLEYDNFLPPEIFSQDFSAKNGFIFAPVSPGTGVEVTEDARKKYRIDSIVVQPSLKLRCRL